MTKLSAGQARRREDAQRAIERLEATLAKGDNRFREYWRNVRASIERHRAVIAEVDRIEQGGEVRL